MRIRTAYCVAILGCLASAGWGPYEHRVGGPADIADQANLADFWGQSFELHWKEFPPNAHIVPLFPWTHGCLRNGRTVTPPDYSCMFPRTPTVYGSTCDGKTAEDDMDTLITKMTASHQSAPLLRETARGFRAHNELDRLGHWSLFPGGTKTAWAEHAALELYAGFLVYECQTGMALEGTVAGIPEQMNFAGHAGIILLAQKAFRKAKHTIDSPQAAPEPREPLEVNSLAFISGRINLGTQVKVFTAARKTEARNASLALVGETQLAAWEAQVRAAWPGGCYAGPP